MRFRIIYIPAFEAAVSKPDGTFDFSDGGTLDSFDKYFSKHKPSMRDSFAPRDFLYYDIEKEGLVWMYALTEDFEAEEYETIEFEGGYYISYFYEDGDDDANSTLYQEALDYIASLEHIELDVRANHYTMGHIITPKEVIDKVGWAQMETYIPVKLIKDHE